MEVAVDGDLCMCTGFCTRIAPELFELRHAEPTLVLQREVPGELEDAAREAEAACPAAAIVVTD